MKPFTGVTVTVEALPVVAPGVAMVTGVAAILYGAVIVIGTVTVTGA